MFFFHIANEFAQLGRQRARYFESVYNAIDILLALLFVAIVALHIASVALAAQVDWGTQDRFVPVARLSNVISWETALLSLVVFLAWFKLLEFLSVYRQVSRFVVMIEMMLRRLLTFFVLFAIILSAFASAEFIAYGYQSRDSSTWLLSFLAKFSAAFSGADLAQFNARNRVLGHAYAILFIVMVALLMLNLIIAIMTTAYEEAKAESGASYWAKRQYEFVRNRDESSAVTRGIDAILVAAYALAKRVLDCCSRSLLDCCGRNQGATATHV